MDLHNVGGQTGQSFNHSVLVVRYVNALHKSTQQIGSRKPFLAS